MSVFFISEKSPCVEKEQCQRQLNKSDPVWCSSLPKFQETLDLSNDIRNDIEKEIKLLESFNACSGWIQNYIKRNGFISSKGAGLVDYISAHTTCNARDDLKKALCKFSMKDICNTDEI